MTGWVWKVLKEEGKRIACRRQKRGVEDVENVVGGVVQ